MRVQLRYVQEPQGGSSRPTADPTAAVLWVVRSTLAYWLCPDCFVEWGARGDCEQIPSFRIAILGIIIAPRGAVYVPDWPRLFIAEAFAQIDAASTDSFLNIAAQAA